MSDVSSELRQLLSELLDGKLSDEDRQRLGDILRDNPKMQQLYREVVSLHALLYLDFSQGYRNLIPPLIEKQLPTFGSDPAHSVGNLSELAEASIVPADDHRQSAVTPRNKRTGWKGNFSFRSWAAVAASVAVLAAGIWWTSTAENRVEPNFVQQTAEPSSQNALQDQAVVVGTTQSVAVLGQAMGAKWSATGSIPNIGGALAAGEFELEQGLVQLEFLSGAAVIIEGPASFELVSASRVICHRGKLRARVPAQAHGFRIETPDYAAVDLGTEFTVHVADDGQSDFHVLDGEVELWDLQSDDTSPSETLTTGRSARATTDGQLAEVSEQQLPMVGSRQLLEISELAQQDRFALWRQFSSELRARPDVVLYYGLDGHQEWERELRNDGLNDNELLTGAIVGCQWTTGRWTGKQALEFKRITDRVRLNVPGEYESLTYATWVRIEGLERWLTSLMLTDGHDANEVHWQITEQGALLLGVNDGDRKLHDYFSPRVLGPRDLGRWVHLAVVIDGNRGVVRHYLDGKQISSEQIKSPSHLAIGKAEIGNWAPNDQPGYRIRSLNGRIDEFIIFSRPLEGEEILEIYEAGKPGS